MSNNELKKKIVKWAKEYKFSNVGFTDIDLSIEEERLKDWLNNKFHGDMHYMEKHGEKRTKPELLTPGTISIISFSANYLDFNTENPIKVLQTKDKAYISRYALGQDYHFIKKDKLKKIAQLINQHTDSFKYRTFVDSAPVMEKPIAEKAGLGWIGKHTNLINRDNGSWFFIGEIYSNIRFDIDKKEDNFCGSCSNCISACPTNAIVAPYKLDARKCISYLTIEYKGVIPIKYRKQIGNRIFGCDDCQLVCPWNKFAKKTNISSFNSNKGLDNISLLELFSWSEKKFKKETESSPINRINYNQWLRNIAIGLGNSNKSKEIILSSDCSLYAFPKTNAKKLAILNTGNSLFVLRQWKINERDMWVRVELATNIFINDSINNMSEQMNLSLCFGEYDQCGVCGGDNSPNTGLCDCNGTPNGLAEQDCFGTCNGTATIDNCGNCYGGNTGIDACVQDECGVWGGPGAGANQCCGENIPAVTEPVCLDTDNGAVDPYGDDCAAYNDYPSWCGNYDDDDFISNEMCCICDGGTITEDIVSPEILALGPNGELQDCAGICGGCATEDAFGVCDGLSTCQIVGDLNSDLSVNIVDVIFLVNTVLATNYITEGDFNNDNVVNIVDIIFLVNIILEQ